jgi:hypothetical protein
MSFVRALELYLVVVRYDDALIRRTETVFGVRTVARAPRICEHVNDRV